MADHKLYNIQPIPGKGMGLVANSKIPKGTRILSESAVFKVPRHTNDLSLLESMIITEIKKLSKDEQRAVMSLHNAFGASHNLSVGIARTNALPLGSNASEGGLFLIASRINHSCRHNSQNTWNANLNQITIHAFEDIEEGEEITISSVDGSKNYADRQRILNNSFGFTCACSLCSLPTTEREASDRRLDEITRLDDSIGDGISIVRAPLECLQNAHALLLLLEDEGTTDARVPRLYYDAFQIAIANGDQARAKVLAERARDARAILEGEDSPETIRLQGFARAPAEHTLFGTSIKWKQAVNKIPQSMNDEEFENWLWRRTR